MEKISRKIAGHRLLARNQQQTGLFDFPLRLVDQLVTRDEFFGQLFVAIGKRLDSLLLQLVHHRRQVDKLLFDMSELQIEIFPGHVCTPSSARTEAARIISSFGREVKSC